MHIVLQLFGSVIYYGYFCIVKEKIKYCVYVTTDATNGIQYVGCHKSGFEWDGYLGSGTRILKMLREHGRDAFSLELMSEHNTRHQALEAERELIEQYVSEGRDLYNITHNHKASFSYTEESKLESVTVRVPKELMGIIASIARLDSVNPSDVLRASIESGLVSVLPTVTKRVEEQKAIIQAIETERTLEALAEAQVVRSTKRAVSKMRVLTENASIVKTRSKRPELSEEIRQNQEAFQKELENVEKELNPEKAQEAFHVGESIIDKHKERYNGKEERGTGDRSA